MLFGMHVCLLKAKKILEVGLQGSTLSIYTYLTYHSLHDNRKIMESCLLNKTKAKKECNRLIPSKTQV